MQNNDVMVKSDKMPLLKRLIESLLTISDVNIDINKGSLISNKIDNVLLKNSNNNNRNLNDNDSSMPINYNVILNNDKICNENNILNNNYKNLDFNSKLYLELKSIGLIDKYNQTPVDFIVFLNSLIGKNQFDFGDNFSKFITQESIKFGMPYSCIDSKLNRNGYQKSYVKFVCKFHTNKRTSCNSKFKIYFENKIIKNIDFIDMHHNHSIERIYIESKVPLITEGEKILLREAAQKGLSTSSLRKLTNLNLLPQQMYNIIRSDKKEYFSNEILNLQNYVNEISNNYDILWKNDSDNKFYNLIVINSRIKKCAYANDIVVLDDTMCTNNFDYPFLVFLVFDENNMVQVLAISIITGKNEQNFIDILLSIKSFIPSIRVFIVDRLKSQKKAINKIYPLSKIIYCRLHIERNIIKNIKINNIKYLLNVYKEFINEQMDKDQYINKLSNIMCKNHKSCKHIQALIKDVDHYDPKLLKEYNLKGHTTTNSIEGIFGNIKKQTEQKIMPLHAVLNLFVKQSENLIKNNINFKHSIINEKIYQYQDLGEYAIKILNARYDECIKIILKLNNENISIQREAHDIIDKCNCIKDDFPCIHKMYNRIISISNGEPLINKNEIPKKYYIHSLIHVSKSKYIVQNIDMQSKENWSYNELLDKLIPYISCAQRSEQLKNCFRNFFNEVDKIKIEIDPNAQSVIKTPGAQVTVPSKMVDIMKKKKRNHCCSKCGKPGHYSRTCHFTTNNN